MKKLRISARHSHLAFGLIQSAITCALAAGIASIPFVETGSFAIYWAKTWAISWISMLPIVIFAAPFIRALVDRFVRDSEPSAASTKSKAFRPAQVDTLTENGRRSLLSTKARTQRSI
jgi:hypothetical protein